MTSMERIVTTLGHQEPDRIPLFLNVTLHGARELGLSIKEYYSRAEYVVEGQLRMRERYGHDNLIGFFYASLDVESWGGEVIYYDDGPPNSGEPILAKRSMIPSLEPPEISSSPRLQEILKTISALKEKSAGEVPVLGVIVSPYSLPVMQMGFGSYLELIYEDPDLFQRLMRINEEYCVMWANAQIDAGATAITYFDPLSSTTIMPREQFMKTGFDIAKSTIGRIHGPVVMSLASGRCIPIVDDIAKTGAVAVGTSTQEDLAEVKSLCRNKLTVIGNLNGIDMRNWTDKDAEKMVKEAIANAGPGGGFILSDNHGEIPWQVKEETLDALCDAVNSWGNYPLDWIEDNG